MKRLFLSMVLIGWGRATCFAAHHKTAADLPTTQAMNQMIGTIQSVDLDNRLLRLQTENGFNVEFAFDRDTVCKAIGAPKGVTDLAYKDQVIVRYAGKELLAREIETRSLQPAIANSSPTLPAN